MIRPIYYSFNSAKKILSDKKLLIELHELLENLSSIEHHYLIKEFRKKGWRKEKLFPNRRYDCDAYKDGAIIEIEGVNKNRTIDYYHCKFFRFMAWHSERKLDVAILITGTKPTNEFSNGAFEKMKEDLVDFNNTLTIPIYLVGLQE